MAEPIEQRRDGAPAVPAWEYADAPESKDIVQLQDRYGLFIGGEFVEPKSGRYMPTIDPSTEEVLAEVPEAGQEDVELAVTAARDAFESRWRDMPGRERAKYLYRIARALQERAREFAVLESMNGGKPIKESRDIDLPLAAAHFFYYAGWADKLDYAFPGRDAKPIGVAGQVIPWNFPMLMAAWKLAPALATGNTTVLKPAETTPLTALLLAEVIQAGGAAAGHRQRAHGGGGDRRRPRRRGRRQGGVHRFHGGRQGRSGARSRGRTSASPSSSGARQPTSCSRTRRSTKPSRVSSTGSSSTRVTCAARARVSSCRSRSSNHSWRS